MVLLRQPYFKCTTKLRSLAHAFQYRMALKAKSIEGNQRGKPFCYSSTSAPANQGRGTLRRLTAGKTAGLYLRLKGAPRMGSPSWPHIEEALGELITATQAGTVLGVSYTSVRRYIKRGTLKGIVIGRDTWVRRSDVEALA